MPAFLKSGTIDILGWIILCGHREWDESAGWRMFPSLPCFYLLDDRIPLPPASYNNQKWLKYQMPHWDKTVSG